MSSEENTTGRTQGRVVWRSLEEKAEPTRLQAEAAGSDVVKQHVAKEELFQLNRRNFLTLSGAMTTLASVEGCIRRPVENILPYTDMPEYVNPGVASHYATAVSDCGEAIGVVGTSREGRPTKLEGNPEHPTSRGATSLWVQSSILDLYDPDRLRSPMQNGAPSDFAAFDKFFSEKVATLKQKGGAGLYILTQPSMSPTYVRARQLVVDRMPSSRIAVYTPVPNSNAREAARLALGVPAHAIYDYARAKVVLSLDSDFLGTDPGSTLASRQYANARDMESAGASMNRLYAVEPTLSVTGSNADHRLRLAAQDIARYARALAAELASMGVELGPVGSAVRGAPGEGIPEQWIKVVARDLYKNRGQCLIVVGPRQPVAVHALAYALNRALGNSGKTVTFTEPVDAQEPENFDSLKTLVSMINAGRVDTLLVLGGNPVYDAPADLNFAEALKKVPNSIAFNAYSDETASLCTWQVPRAHELESWGDQQSTRGDYSVQQPLIAPLWGGRTDAEVLGFVAGEPNWRAYDLVKATVEGRGIKGEVAWRKTLHKGIADTRFGAVLGSTPLRDQEIAAAVQRLGSVAPLAANTFEAVFAVDNKVLDGRFANNSWLQELPDPITRITWDNAALFAPSTAKQLQIKNGDMVRIKHGDRAIDIVAWLQPGTAAQSIILPLGWGRKAAGKVGNNKGFNVYPLRTLAGPHFVSGVTVEKLAKTYPLSQTQEHDSMEGRPLAVDATLAEYKNTPNFPEYVTPDPAVTPLWKMQDYSTGEQWGMTIDLNTCTGCASCVIACQAENNIPVVGKVEVARGREMSWLRIDRYYVGDNEDEPDIAFQPVGCQHCEVAPCENVCPVAATSHSPSGLNDIAYNRCIGTRYCMNNCPYKVRRFNFLNFNQDIPETTQMQLNPSVTVRFRGVIEKCSYCVQRIEGARISARQKGRTELRDGEVQAACAQACSTGAITFGNINDPNALVTRRRNRDRNYALLSEIGTRPRTRFLGKIRNPNPEMKAVKS
ncbi:MAG TPA: 4Fe-4S dicluster domain-containing protein [Polyangiales bacterium]|nr:4Fe-4S dicluster domain-containing protein [Polyangiales bacterium]